MNPTRIALLGEDYFLFSHTGTETEADGKPLYDGMTVNLFPSLTADFCVRLHNKSGTARGYDPTAAICAAAHLSLVRGLPLDEFDFETPGGALKIFRTGDGFFALTISKRKLLFTESVEILGSDVCYADVLILDRVYRVVHTENISSVDRAALKPLLLHGRYLPEAVLFSSVTDGEIYILPYTDFNPSPPSRLGLFLAAAISYRGELGMLSAHGGMLLLDAGYSSVKLRIKCEIK